jgi:hypothetical protein
LLMSLNLLSFLLLLRVEVCGGSAV